MTRKVSDYVREKRRMFELIFDLTSQIRAASYANNDNLYRTFADKQR